MWIAEFKLVYYLVYLNCARSIIHNAVKDTLNPVNTYLLFQLLTSHVSFAWKEKDMQKLRDSKIHQDILDREASLLRAKTEAALSEGISWGMTEDAIEDAAEVSVFFREYSFFLEYAGGLCIIAIEEEISRNRTCTTLPLEILTFIVLK
jgi:hypothetical protein